MSDFAKRAAQHLRGDPISAIVLDEDGVGLADTIRHLEKIGFQKIVIASRNSETGHDLGHPVLALPDAGYGTTLTPLIRLLAGQWLHICFNAEFLTFPFAETRTIQDFYEFIKDERRSAAHVMVVDHYAQDLATSVYGYNLEDAHFDGSGFYAHHQETPKDPKEPIVEVYGGLRWRYEEEFPEERRRCTRASLFKCSDTTVLEDTMLFKDPHMNTLQCPWHHSPTAALRSFRAAKYLMINPGSRKRLDSLMWARSVACDWSSQQMMEYGFIEPGQWF